MTVATLLRQHLADARRRGEPFAEAWPEALKRATAGQRRDERDAWTTALHATREAWEAAFERRPASAPERAVLAIATDEAMPASRGAARPPIRERVAA